VAFRSVLPSGVGENESTDFTLFYQPVAERLADGHGLEVAEDQPALRYPPGYPIVLAGAFVLGDAVGLSRGVSIDLVTVVAASAAGVLLHLAARRVFDRRHAWLSSALWMAYPLTLWTAKQPNSELPFMVALYGAVLLLTTFIVDREGPTARLLAAGALLGLAATIRPLGLLFLPVVALVLGVRLLARPGHRAALVLAFVVAGAVPIALASGVMSAAAHTPVLLSDANEVNLLEGLSFAADSRAEADSLPMPGGLTDFVVETQAREVELSAPGAAEGYLADSVRDRPGVVAQLVAFKALRSWYGTESFRYEGLIAAIQLVWATAATVGAVLCWRHGGGRRWYAILTGALTVGSWAAAVAALSIVRYLVPALGLFAPLVAVALLVAWDGLAVRRGRAAGTAPGPGGAGGVRPVCSGPSEHQVLGAAREPAEAALDGA